MLTVTNLQASYGSSQVLFDVNLAVKRGQVATLLGRNGMGKTTTVSAIMGLVRPQAGRLEFDGQPIHGWRADEIARAGIGLVPEGRQIFPDLTVLENLTATAANRNASPHAWTLNRVLDLFPSLHSRRHNLGMLLSGGEQQMLSIGRALMTNPRLLILDEATEGLSPLIRGEIWRTVHVLKEAGLSILLIDKNVRALARFADWHYILEKGSTVWEGSSQALMGDETLREKYLGV